MITLQFCGESLPLFYNVVLLVLVIKYTEGLVYPATEYEP